MAARSDDSSELVGRNSDTKLFGEAVDAEFAMAAAPLLHDACLRLSTLAVRSDCSSLVVTWAVSARNVAAHCGQPSPASCSAAHGGKEV